MSRKSKGLRFVIGSLVSFYAVYVGEPGLEEKEVRWLGQDLEDTLGGDLTHFWRKGKFYAFVTVPVAWESAAGMLCCHNRFEVVGKLLPSG